MNWTDCVAKKCSILSAYNQTPTLTPSYSEYQTETSPKPRGEGRWITKLHRRAGRLFLCAESCHLNLLFTRLHLDTSVHTVVIRSDEHKGHIQMLLVWNELIMWQKSLNFYQKWNCSVKQAQSVSTFTKISTILGYLYLTWVFPFYATSTFQRQICLFSSTTFIHWHNYTMSC